MKTATSLLTLASLLFLSIPAHAQIMVWASAVSGDGAIVVDTTERLVTTNVAFDFGSISSAGTYEFILNAAPQGASQMLAMANDSRLKFAQYNNTGRLGFTTNNHDYTFTAASSGSDASPFGSTAMVAFVIDGTGTKVYVNGVYAGGSTLTMTPLSGAGFIGAGVSHTYDDETFDFIDVPYDQMNATFYGVATFDTALTAEQIADHYTAFAGSGGSPVPEPSTWGLLAGLPALAFVGLKRLKLRRQSHLVSATSL